ncbi:hypothetical protein Pan216_52780 [Planctomycetes bacterium Pan216]|uniref:Glycosyltransferase RgtA/B/C/D-like domain-containing protein n=1 Tax=Kolteria novifilia TaxID=2527975 RepID=A0A518BBM6_9BACT|nr:hypothetical protein Pan216_52780 [Planctomycetes bacterium Pan216]
MSQADSKPLNPLTLSLDRRAMFWGILITVLALLAGYTWRAKSSWSPNDRSRWNTVWSLVEYGTYRIYDTDEEAKAAGKPRQFKTIDKVRTEDGLRSSKPPLMPTLIAGYVHALRLVFGREWSLSDKKDPTKGSFEIYSKATLYFFQFLPFAIFLILYRRYLDQYATTDFGWVFCLLAAALGTLLTGYLVTLNNHVIAGCFGFMTYSMVLSIWCDRAEEPWRYALAGLCAGWTFANELPAGLLIIAVFALLLVRDPKKAIFGYLPPLGLVIGAMFWTNYLAVDSLLPAYIQKNLYDYSGSYWTSSAKSGIDALNDHPEHLVVYFLNMTIGHHGIFSLTPIWIFSAWGMILLARDRSSKLAPIAWSILFISAGVFAFFWLVTDQRNYGGFCHGLRWLAWLSPLWLLSLPTAIDRIADSKIGCRLAWASLAVSIFSVGDTLASPWSRSWLQRIFLWSGIIDY